MLIGFLASVAAARSVAAVQWLVLHPGEQLLGRAGGHLAHHLRGEVRREDGQVEMSHMCEKTFFPLVGTEHTYQLPVQLIGFTYGELRRRAQDFPAIGGVLDEIDMLIDGPYVSSLANGAGPWTGSSNQRVLTLKPPQSRDQSAVTEG